MSEPRASCFLCQAEPPAVVILRPVDDSAADFAFLGARCHVAIAALALRFGADVSKWPGGPVADFPEGLFDLPEAATAVEEAENVLRENAGD